MPKFHERWTVFPHGPVKTIDDALLSVEGEIHMPLGRFPRRMTVAALTGGGTVIFSPIALEKPAMRQVEELGAPKFLIVPNGFHRLDSRIWKQRYPEVKVICPPGAKERVSEAVAVDATRDIMEDPAVELVIVSGMGDAEAALVVRRKAGTTLVLNDVISNVRHPEGLGANIMARLFGFGVKRPQMAREIKWLLVRDKRALAAQLRRWSQIDDLRRLIVSHGEMIEKHPQEVLRAVALTLD